MKYLPSLVGNAFFLAYYGAFLIPQVFLGIRYKTWGFLIGMISGLTLEVIGYVARIQMRQDEGEDKFLQ